VRTRSRYFFGASLVLLALVFLGFAPTFYLRPFFGRIGPLWMHLTLHSELGIR
jgi:hypothetical protein